MIHFDFCYLWKGENGNIYVLITKDYFSGYVRLRTVRAADCDTTPEVLMDWFTLLRVSKTWILDGGLQFLNNLVTTMCQKLRSKDHFTVPYCPWSNGTIRLVCRELLHTCRAAVSEFQVSFSAWPSLVPLVQPALNCAPVKRLKNKCPMTLF